MESDSIPSSVSHKLKKEPLELITKILDAGRIIRKPSQRHLYLLVIDNLDDLVHKLIPFLDKYQSLLYIKRESYRIFKDIVIALYKGLHKDVSKLKDLILKAYNLSSLSSKAHRKRGLNEVFAII